VSLLPGQSFRGHFFVIRGNSVFSFYPHPWKIANLNTAPKNTVFFLLKYSLSLIPFSPYFAILEKDNRVSPRQVTYGFSGN